MRFSDQFNVARPEEATWFDPVLSIDTKLFLDPFLIYSGESDEFAGSHAEVIRFFNDAFVLVARSGGSKTHLMWKQAQSLLVFPEAAELCLGYTAAGTKGSGSGAGFAATITAALWEAVEAGIQSFEHFEEVGILRGGIGADRISDITANLLRHRFAAYTTRVCAALSVPLQEFKYPRGMYSPEYQRWMPLTFWAPRNPYTTRPVLLAPHDYLRDLPTISSEPFWDFCFYNENETLRQDFGADIARRVDKKTIVDFARRHPEVRARFMRDREFHGSKPYNYGADRKGLVRWYDATAEYCKSVPRLLGFASDGEFKAFNLALLEEFRNYVENNGGWKLLWNDNDTAKSEEASQLLFLGVVKHYCHANNIDISKEVNVGRGPVDFKSSQGHQSRALLELKLARNSKFWHGLSRQLPKYLEAEGVSVGYFIVIVQSPEDERRLRDIQAAVAAVNARTGYDITAFTIDAQKDPPSASKL